MAASPGIRRTDLRPRRAADVPGDVARWLERRDVQFEDETALVETEFPGRPDRAIHR
jgi:hypothetical protein